MYIVDRPANQKIGGRQMYIKIVSYGGWGTLIPASKITWGPALKSDADKVDGDKFYVNDTQELGEITHILADDKNYWVDVTRHTIYLLGEDGQTVDRIP
mgnify:CR=1 FL=1